MVRQIKYPPRYVGPKSWQQDKNWVKMSDIMVAVPHNLQEKQKGFHYGYTKNKGLICKACDQNKLFDTVEQVRFHCASHLHRQCMQLYMMRKKYQQLLKEHRKLQQDKATARNDDLDESMSVNEELIPMQLKKDQKRRNQAVTNVIATQKKTQEMLQIANLDDQSEHCSITNELDNNIDNLKDANQTSIRILKFKPWVEIPELKKISQCQQSQTLNLKLHKDIKISLFQHQEQSWFKNYNSLVNKLSQSLHTQRNKSICTLMYDFIGGHASQLTKAKAVINKFQDAYGLKHDKGAMKAGFKNQLKIFKNNREQVHQFWSDEDLQMIYDAFYCCHPYTRLFFYFALITGCRQVTTQFFKQIQR